MSHSPATESPVAWITGGGTGIGKALAKALCLNGYAVAISGRRADVLQETLKELIPLSPFQRVMAIPTDISDAAQVKDAEAQISAAFGEVDLLLNNAGWNPTHHLDDTTSEEFQKTFAINCLGAIHTVQAVLPGMRRKGSGTIVNVGSVLGHFASASSAAYSVAKYAVTGFTDALRQELVHEPIHVLGVYPGYIETEMTRPFVPAGSWKLKIGVKPETMAAQILKAVRKRKSELYYPFYVPWLIRMHRLAPLWMDRLTRKAHP